MSYNYDRRRTAETALELAPADPNVVLHEHEGPRPTYMAVSNLRNTISNCEEMMKLLNEQDELPAWTEEMLASAKMSTAKALDYIRSQKAEV